MKKRIVLCAALLAFFVGQAEAKGFKRMIFGAKKAKASGDKRNSKSKLPENLDEVYGPSILVATFDPIAEAKSPLDPESN